MRKRVAAKVVARSYSEEPPAYRKRTSNRAADKLWRSCRGGRWHVSGCRRVTAQVEQRDSGVW